jgi:hypothetical protein
MDEKKRNGKLVCESAAKSFAHLQVGYVDVAERQDDVQRAVDDVPQQPPQQSCRGTAHAGW